MSAAGSLWTSSVLQTVGLALVHFLWQGALIGAVLALALTLLRRHSPEVRYSVCVLGMTAMMVMPIVTTLSIVLGGHSGAVPRLTILHLPRSSGPTPDWLAALLPWVTVLWASGAFALQLRLAACWLLAEHLRRSGTRPAPARWRQELDRIRERLGVTRVVGLVESTRVRVPSIVGWLRPVVLLPARLVDRLTPEQIRSLIAHEVAHVKRHDYLVNVVQHVFESVLFFHPVTWWVSARLRAERECCCDDIVLSMCDSAVSYARALSELEELRDREIRPALASAGGSLMKRISRILGTDRTPPASGARWPVPLATLAGLIAVAVLAGAGCQTDSASPVEATPLTSIDGGAQGPSAVPAQDEEAVNAAIDLALDSGCITSELATEIRSRIEDGLVEITATTCGEAGATCIQIGMGCEGMTAEEMEALCGEAGCTPIDCSDMGAGCCGGAGTAQETEGVLPDGRRYRMIVQQVAEGD
jgi:beta-lactamase regulating signal transducer with metallopeptidase domain